MSNKKLCGHNFDEDCECAANILASSEMQEMMYKTNDLFFESRKIFELISNLENPKYVKENPKYIRYILHSALVLTHFGIFRQTHVTKRIQTG